VGKFSKITAEVGVGLPGIGVPARPVARSIGVTVLLPPLTTSAVLPSGVIA
jgi:hypothetical protein